MTSEERAAGGNWSLTVEHFVGVSRDARGGTRRQVTSAQVATALIGALLFVSAFLWRHSRFQFHNSIVCSLLGGASAWLVRVEVPPERRTEPGSAARALGYRPGARCSACGSGLGRVTFLENGGESPA